MTHACLAWKTRRRRAPARPWVLAAACLLLPAVASAQSAVRYGRPWGAPGDSAGAAPQRLTIGASMLDRDGSGAKLAEDEGLVDRWRGFAIFDYRRLAGERTVVLRGRLSSDDRMPGSFELSAARTGVDRYRIFYRRLTHYDDPTADDPYQRDPDARRFRGDPLVRWAAAGLDWTRRLGPGWRVRAGYEHVGQEGTRAGLGRGLIGEPYLFGPAAALGRDVLSHRVWLGGAHDGARVALDWNAEFQSDGGDRAAVTTYRADPTVFTDRHAWQDERRTWNLRAGGSWEVGRRLTVLANYGYLGRFARPQETLVETPVVASTVDAAADDIAANIRAHTGAAALVWRPWVGLRLRLGARVQQLDQSGLATLRRNGDSFLDTRSSFERARTRQVYTLGFQQAAGRGTVLTGDWRHEFSDETTNSVSLDEFAGGNVLLRVQSGERERALDVMGLRLRHRLSARLSADGRVEYRNEDVNDRHATLLNQYGQGDRNFSRLRAAVGARARLATSLDLDAGGELLAEDFARRDGVDARSEWDAHRLFAVGSWQPWTRLALFTSFAWGVEQYGLDGPLPAAAADPAVTTAAEYKGTTYRFSPGAVLSLAHGLQVEGHYERIRNRDSVANDSDRWYGRVTAALGGGIDASATYRRYAFSAGYDDDYDADLYGVALSTRF